MRARLAPVRSAPAPTVSRRLALAGVLALALMALPSTAVAQEAPEAGYKVGTFKFLEAIDGDTIRIEKEGRPVSLRLLGIDTEETFHDDERAKRAAEADFEAYCKAQRGSSPRPVKFGTPFGEAARVFAEEFFEGVDTVEVERDDPLEQFGYYGRLLSYVFVVKDGKRIHYNVEVVRAGFSPYYVKYGRSRRYEKDFLMAEAEARKAGRGVWGDWKKNLAYPDYKERLAWWRERSDLIDRWRARVAKNSALPEDQRRELISLDQSGVFKRLRGLAGRRIILRGSIDKFVHPSNKATTLVLSAGRDQTMDADLTVRLKDGGRFRREHAVLEGQVVVENDRVKLRDAKLLAPEIASGPIPTNEPPTKPGSTRTPKRPRSSGGRRPKLTRITLNLEDQDAGKVVGRLVKEHGLSLAIGKDTGDWPRARVTLRLFNVTPGEALSAILAAAGARYERITWTCFAVLPKAKSSDAAAELSRRLEELNRQLKKIHAEMKIGRMKGE